MEERNNSDSEFGRSPAGVESGPIDFSRATKLERSGSTCDVYRARIYNKTVFVKRLKPELRSAPCERTAFAKEFELGINLIHPALPVYRDMQDDYLVMDYIDGITRADMFSYNRIKPVETIPSSLGNRYFWVGIKPSLSFFCKTNEHYN